ncbi:hypothetical protein [Shewanella woodyi]|uniref:hypothetical protein n=1 Tax=Shewanella woodyi TaxID=60961 RepID=UPI0012FC55E7|nr:hypothetical protein [Shewanella woodyi]
MKLSSIKLLGIFTVLVSHSIQATEYGNSSEICIKELNDLLGFHLSNDTYAKDLLK